MQIEDSSFINDFIINLVSLDKFMSIDINLINSVNLTDLTLKVILLVIKDRLRIKNLFLIKLVIIRSQF